MSAGPEWEKVESPLLNQLDALKWKVRTGNPVQPSTTGRETFGQVILEQDLRA